MDTRCANFRTPLRRLLVFLAPPKPPWWLTARMCWRAYGFLEWAAWRMQDVAMELESRHG